MKFYSLDTEFTFGKYESKTVREILEIQPSYLDWCAINLEHFYISEEVIDEIKATYSDFKISEEGMNKLNENTNNGKVNKKILTMIMMIMRIIMMIMIILMIVVGKDFHVVNAQILDATLTPAINF